MSDSDDFDPGSEEEDNESEDYEPPSKKKRSSKSKKKTFPDSDDSIDSSPKKRRSPRNSKQPQPAILELDSSGSDQENQPIINKPKPKRNSKRNSKSNETPTTTNNSRNKRRNSSKSKEPPQNDNDADDESDSPKPNKRGRKRKKSEANLEDPPPKKQRTSTSSNSSNSSKKSKKPAKKKKQSRKSKGDEATERVKDFMIEQNRPFTASAIKNEFVQNPMGLAQIKKSLVELKEDGILVMREFGKKTKTQLYWRNQDTFSDEDGDDDEMSVQQRIQDLEEELKRKRSEMIRIKNECLKLQKEPTDAKMEMEMEMLTGQFNDTNKQLEAFENGDIERVSQDDLNEKLLAFHPFGKAWKERRNVTYEMISTCFMDHKDKPDKILTKTLRGETDKENDVNWDDYKEMYKKACTLVQQQRDAQRRRRKK